MKPILKGVMKVIKVRLYTDEEYYLACAIDCNGRQDHVFDYGQSFDSVLYNLHDYHAKPFRDAESLRFLKEVENVEFISDDDWYTVMWDNERTCITGIHKEWKFGLMAIEHSRDGRYIWYYPAGEKVWNILNDMPFDILIGRRMLETGIHHSDIGGVDYQIINFPYGGKEIEVTVKKDYIRLDNDFYTEIRGTHGLCLGKDGRYYMSSLDVGYALQYYWKNDIGGIIAHIDKKADTRVRLLEINQEYNVFEFAKALGKDENELVGLDYLHMLYCYNCYRDEQGMDDYDEAIKELQSGESYQEYLYFRDKFKVISHIVIAPGDTIFRKLPVLMVDKKYDGSYWIHGGLTYKYPDFCKAIGQVIEDRIQDGERYVLIIDSEELLDSVKDIDRAAYGFKVTPDSIEVFDIEDAVRLFGQMLKEAYTSDKCVVDKDFY